MPEVLPFDALMEQVNQHLKKDAPDYAEKIAKLRSHPVVGGVAGSIADQQRRIQAEQDRIEQEASAAKKAQDDLLRLAEEDPEEFAARFRTQAQADKARAELENLRESEEKRIAGLIGVSTRELLGDEPLNVGEQRRIADALARSPRDKVLATYEATMLDILADRRSLTKAETLYQARFQEDYEARRLEENTNRIRTAPAPDLRAATTAVLTDAPDPISDPAGYVRWIDGGGRRRTA